MRALNAGLIAAVAAACNGAPNPPLVGITPESPGTADPLLGVIVEEAYDVEGDPVTYAWAWSVDGVPQPDLTSPEVPAEHTARGQVWELSVTPSDLELTGRPGTAGLTIANTPPSATLALTPDAPLTTDDLVPTLDAHDLDGDDVQFRYAWMVDGLDARWTEATVPAQRTATGQRWSVTATPIDDVDAGEPVAAEVEIGNSSPSLLAAHISPTAPVTGSDLVVVVEAVDADDDALSTEVTWFVDDVQVEGSIDGSLDADRFSKGQVVTAQVSVSDAYGSSEPLLTEPVVVRNSPPTVRLARIEPLTLFEGSVATVVGGSWHDDDGDPESYRVAWTVNGEAAGEGATLDGTAFDRGDVVACEVTPFDGEDEGEAVTCSPTTVQNSGPTIGSASITPDPGRTGDDLSVLVSGVADPDGDDVSVSYAWTINGTSAGTATTLLSALTVKGDVVEVTATPSDGAKTGTPSTASLTISNTAPTVTSVALTPDPLRTRDEATVSWTGADVDGDSVTATVTWTVDGVSAGTGDTLGWTHYQRGDVVAASLVLSDGTDSSAASSASTTVANSPPTSPSTTITPAYPQEDDDLLCTISTPATDDDGDPVTYTMRWTKNLKLFTSTSTTTHANDTVSSADTAAANLFGCTARANDGIDTGGVSWPSTVRIAGGTVDGFSGEIGPKFTGWTQCEGYYDTRTTGEIPSDWGDDCTDTGFDKLRLVCGTSTSSYRYIDVSKNVFRDKLTGYPESGIITDARDDAGTAFTVTNSVWAKSDDPHKGASWWGGSQGCGESYPNLTVNNRCTYEASNCFGQGLTSANRYLWVYAGY